MKSFFSVVSLQALLLAANPTSAQNIFRTHNDASAKAQDVSYGAGGKLLVVATHEKTEAGDVGEILVYDAQTETLKTKLNGRASCCAAVSPDGTTIASFTYGSGLVLTNLADTSKRRIILEDKMENVVFKCAFSPDGTTLALGGFGGSIRLLDVASGKITKSLKSNSADRLTVKLTYTSDGRLVSAGGDIIKVWDTKTGKELLSIPVPPGEKTLVSAVSTNSNRVVCSYSDNSYVYDLTTGKELHKVELGGFYNAAYSPDGKIILLTSKQGVFAFHGDFKYDETNGKGIKDIEWLAINPTSDKVAFVARKALELADVAAMAEMAGKP